MDLSGLGKPGVKSTIEKDGKNLSAERAFNPALRVRLLFIIINASLIILLVSAIVLISYQRRQLVANAQSTTIALSNTIEANLQHAMLTDDWRLANEVINAVAMVEGIEVVRLINKDGRVNATSVEGELGHIYNRSEDLCKNCHIGNLPARDENVIYRGTAGYQVLITANVIENRIECHTCHLENDSILGVLMIETPLTAINQQMARGFWSTTLVALVSFALLVGLIMPMLNRHVIRPVEELSKGVAAISRGDLDYHVPVINQDELGNLAAAFESMRQELKFSHAQMAQREYELAILNEVGLAATQILDLEKILEFTLDTMVVKLGFEQALIYLDDLEHNRFTLRAARGMTPGQLEEIDRRRLDGDDLTQSVADTGEELYIPDMATEPRFLGIWDQLEERSYLKLPLISRGTIVGVLGLVTPVGKPITPPAVQFIKAVGREISISIDNASLLAKTRLREEQAVLLYRLGTQISASLSLSKVLQAVAEAARELLEADIGLVGLLDEPSMEVVIRGVAGVDSSQIKGFRLPLDDHTPQSTLVSGQPLVFDLSPDDPLGHLEAYLVSDTGMATILAVPLVRGERFLGLIQVMRHQRRRFRGDDANLLLRLANQVVVSMENANLYRQLHNLATLEERDRLAREMHDHLAQGLGFLKIKASMTDDLLAEGQIERAQEGLAELKKYTHILYTDVREDIFNLRSGTSERVNFYNTLQEYISDYRTHYGLAVHLIIDNEELVEFSPEVSTQLLRIIQEALTNIRRHADAHRVLIHFHQKEEAIQVLIEDDGQGFHPVAATRENGGHYGLQIMRERAESVSGTLRLDSKPGKGTRVIINMPVEWEN